MTHHALAVLTFLLLSTAFDVSAQGQQQNQVQVQVWTSNGANKIQQLTETGATDLISSGAITPWGITVNEGVGKLYWTNVTDGTIKQANLDGSNVQTLLSDLDLPRGIALDATSNTLIWAEAGASTPGIKSVDLDESPLVVTEIATSGVISPYHIAIDPEGQFVYWADNASSVKQINRIQYDGSDFETIITDVYVKQVAGLALNASGTALYWSDFEDDLIYSADAVAGDQNVQVVFEITDESTPWAIDIDSDSQILYWTDYLNSSIHQIDLNSSIMTEIAGGISTPSGFVTYTDRGIIPGNLANFITTWISNNSGESEDNEITIPTDPGSSYYYDLYWEDVSNSARNDTINNVSGNLLINFGTPGTYRVEIAGVFPRILFFDPNAPVENRTIDPLKITSINQWGDIEWTSMSHAFYGASNLSLVASDTPDLSAVQDLSYMFFGGSSLDLIDDGLINNWDVSGVTNFEEMLAGAIEFNGDLSNWETSGAQNMSGMFRSNQFFNSDLSRWDVSNVEQFDETFLDAKAFNSDISEWQTGSATSMEGMFQNAESFDQNLAGWSVGNVTEMENMLNNSGLSVENYDKTLIGWNNQTVQPNVNLFANGLQYCRGEGADARQSLIEDDMWTIIDAGLADDCIPTNLEISNDLPTDIRLEQNYPNPFNPTTLINFDLPEAGPVRIIIYDMTGRSVMMLADQSFSAGRHQVTLDASSLSSGVYLYRLEASGITATRKMMLVK